MRKGTWVKEEDELLRQAVTEQRKHFMDNLNTVDSSTLSKQMLKLDWVDVSQRVKTRTGKQCRERWINHLGNIFLLKH